jgi:ATP/maltotriose-dependent transcriptional regulator MalT
MARAWEPDFIQLWQAGASQEAIAQALGIPVGTVKSRAHALAAQGKIQQRLQAGGGARSLSALQNYEFITHNS